MTRVGGYRVLKFGGSALSEPDRIAGRIRSVERRGERPVLIVSARAGVTDSLEEALRGRASTESHRALLERIERTHPGVERADHQLSPRLRRLLSRSRPGGSRPEAVREELLAMGERWAVRWLALELGTSGIPAVPLDADVVGVRLETTPGGNRIRWRASRAAVLRAVLRAGDTGSVPLITGYLGRLGRHGVGTLGRGGSDYSAVAVAAMLSSDEVDLVKRDWPICTADPSVVPQARPLRSLSYDTAEGLALAGARVIHPEAVALARRQRIRIRVVSLLEPGRVSVVGPSSSTRTRALSFQPHLALVEVRSPEGAHRPGLLARWSRALAESGVNIVTLLSTGGRFSFVFGLPDAESARRLLTEEVGELGRPPYPLRKVALITVVGVPTPEVTEAVRRTDISVLGLVAHPDSATVAVPDRWGPTALRSLHRALIPSR